MINSTQKSRSAEILLFYSWLLAPRFFLCKNNWNRLSRRGERKAYRASPTLGTRCGEAIQIDSWTFDSDSLCGYWRNPERSRRPLAPPRPGDADVPTPPPPPPPSSKHSGIAGSRHYEGGYAIDSRTPWCREKRYCCRHCSPFGCTHEIREFYSKQSRHVAAVRRKCRGERQRARTTGGLPLNRNVKESKACIYISINYYLRASTLWHFDSMAGHPIDRCLAVDIVGF